MKITLRQALQMQASLQELGNRFLPTLDADLKIGRLLSVVTEAVQGPARETNRISLRAVEELGGQEELRKLEPLAKQMFIASVQEQQAVHAEMEIELAIKDNWLVTSDDLPKERNGEKGAENASGRGSLIAGLGSLFQGLKD